MVSPNPRPVTAWGYDEYGSTRHQSDELVDLSSHLHSACVPAPDQCGLHYYYDAGLSLCAVPFSTAAQDFDKFSDVATALQRPGVHYVMSVEWTDISHGFGAVFGPVVVKSPWRLRSYTFPAGTEPADRSAVEPMPWVDWLARVTHPLVPSGAAPMDVNPSRLRISVLPTFQWPTPPTHTREFMPSGPPLVAGRFPHACPRCGGPAYVGFSTVECSSPGCSG
jgi:hypothetical protein